MALHGRIEVNGWALAGWSAQRIAGDPPGRCTYRCEVWSETSGDAWFSTLRFEVEHEYAAGAVVLAAVVLAEAQHQMRAASLPGALGGAR